MISIVVYHLYSSRCLTCMDLICQKGRGGVPRKKKMTGGVKYFSPPNFKYLTRLNTSHPCSWDPTYISVVCVFRKAYQRISEGISDFEEDHLDLDLVEEGEYLERYLAMLRK